MEQILIFFMKALTALAYILAMMSPFILIGWAFAERSKSENERKTEKKEKNRFKK